MREKERERERENRHYEKSSEEMKLDTMKAVVHHLSVLCSVQC